MGTSRPLDTWEEKGRVALRVAKQRAWEGTRCPQPASFGSFQPDPLVTSQHLVLWPRCLHHTVGLPWQNSACTVTPGSKIYESRPHLFIWSGAFPLGIYLLTPSYPGHNEKWVRHNPPAAFGDADVCWKVLPKMANSFSPPIAI